MADRYDIKKAHADSQAKQSVDRNNKISSVYRKKQELDALQQELDSIAVKKDVNMSEAEFRKTVVAPLEKKISTAQKALNNEHKKIISSSDKKLVSEYENTLKGDEELSKYTYG